MLHASKDLTSIDKTRKEYIISYWNERAEGFTTLRSHECIVRNIIYGKMKSLGTYQIIHYGF